MPVSMLFGQVANFRCEESALPPRFLRSEETVTDLIRDYFNNALPMDVRVLSVSEAPARFHARLNAKEKHYRYVIDNAAVPDVFTRRYAARIPAEQEARVSYDIEAMQRAANALIGEHDFKSFCDNRHMKKIHCPKHPRYPDRFAGRPDHLGFLRQWISVSYGSHSGRDAVGDRKWKALCR